MAEMMQQYETPIHRRSSMAEVGGHGHRSLFHLSMPDIAANEKQQQPLQKLASSCSGGPRGSAKHRGYRQATAAAAASTAAAAEGQTQQPCPQWTHNKKAQHRHENRGGHLATSSSSSSQKGRETKARQNLNAKLEAVRKLSSESSRSSGGSALSSQACDSGLGTPISLMGDEVSSMTTSSQNSSHLSKWRSSMSGKKRNLRLLLYQLG